VPSPQRDDPYRAFNFRVEIEGVTVAGFSVCTGLEAEVSVVEYRTGAEVGTRKLPGLRKFGDITLKRGITCDRELWNWFQTVLDGKVERRTVSIVLMNEGREEVCRWMIREAWPRKWEGPAFNASSDDVAIESIEIAHEGIDAE
jgi:phage tail-like protein